MSELSNVVEMVQAVTNSLSQTRQSAAVYQRDLTHYISIIINQTDGTAQSDIKDCLIAVRSAINSLQKLQEALGRSISTAYDWLERETGNGTNAPFSSHGLSFGTDYNLEDEKSHSHRR